MAVTSWLESLRAAEKTALLQDGNSSLLCSPPGRALRAGFSWEGLSLGGQSQPRLLPTLAEEETEAQGDGWSRTQVSGHPPQVSLHPPRSSFVGNSK